MTTVYVVGDEANESNVLYLSGLGLDAWANVVAAEGTPRGLRGAFIAIVCGAHAVVTAGVVDDEASRAVLAVARLLSIPVVAVTDTVALEALAKHAPVEPVELHVDAKVLDAMFPVGASTAPRDPSMPLWAMPPRPAEARRPA